MHIAVSKVLTTMVDLFKVQEVASAITSAH